MVVMVASLVLCHISFSTGRTNVLNGAAHLAPFAAYLMTIFARHLYPPMAEIGEIIKLSAYSISSYYLNRLLIRFASPYHNLHETTATADEKPERVQHCAHFRDEVNIN